MDHEYFMEQALALAREAVSTGDVPVGCVIVKDGQIVGRGRNRREERGDATAHAELEAIREACAALGGWRLLDCTMYVTLGPSSTPGSAPSATAPGMKKRAAAARCSTSLRSGSITGPGSTRGR